LQFFRQFGEMLRWQALCLDLAGGNHAGRHDQENQ
jgi:hypothetical protein